MSEIFEIEMSAEQRMHDEVFRMVCNEADWKAPIDSLCSSDEMKRVHEAIVFFTGTIPKFDYLGIVATDHGHGRFKKGDHIVKVRADGYRRGPCGDH